MSQRPAPRRPTHDAIRERALRAAAETVDAEGYTALAARGLAAAAGCSVGTLYNVFGDLDGVVYALNLRTAHALRRALESRVEGAGATPRERLTALADAYLDFATAHPRRWEALFRFRAGGPVDGSLGRQGDALLALLRDNVGEAVGGGVPDDALLALWAAVHGVVELATQQHLRHYASGSERRYLRLILHAAMKAFEAEARSG